jgi:endo-1,4-beta-xylanase
MELNWDHLFNEGDHLRMEEFAALVGEMGKSLHGHTLLWHRSVPRAVQDQLSLDPNWQIVASHIGATIERYGGEIRYWEVVNEPIDTGYRDDGLRGSIFLDAFGPDYIRRALETAAAADPDAKLLINEFGLDYDIPVEQERRHHLLRLLESLLEQGVPLHGLGIQGHLDLQKQPFSQRSFADFLSEVASMGLELVVTELDVRERDLVEPPEVRDRLVAEHVTEYLDVALDQQALTGVITWGITDRHSWLMLTEEDMARFPGAWQDGSGPGLNRGLPFDADLAPKPMYNAIAAAFRRRAGQFLSPQEP